MKQFYLLNWSVVWPVKCLTPVKTNSHDRFNFPELELIYFKGYSGIFNIKWWWYKNRWMFWDQSSCLPQLTAGKQGCNSMRSPERSLNNWTFFVWRASFCLTTNSCYISPFQSHQTSLTKTVILPRRRWELLSCCCFDRLVVCVTLCDFNKLVCFW